MYAYRRAIQSQRDQKSTAPSDELRVAVTFKRQGGDIGPTKFLPPLSLSSAKDFEPNPLHVDQAVHYLSQLGFRPTRPGKLSVSMRATRAVFEQTFSTRLQEVRLDPNLDYASPSVYFPPPDAPWQVPAQLADIIDDAYIQWPHIYMGRRPVRSTKGRRRVARATKSAPRAGMLMAAAAPMPGVSANPPNANYFHLNV